MPSAVENGSDLTDIDRYEGRLFHRQIARCESPRAGQILYHRISPLRRRSRAAAGGSACDHLKRQGSPGPDRGVYPEVCLLRRQIDRRQTQRIAYAPAAIDKYEKKQYTNKTVQPGR